ncbi:hypothetical protein [Hydrogenimonas cancrithermarum]|uniref:Protoporphyrinogen IX oxidase n=1 Tax=Hydrogenimonas cancrithermarum TaxID=2993563 RepID=A0ABN6WWW6_9BACT|nr:hypothetical protein [Hydrogenimonas cancrithermarum]BDY13686.1 hypothetical protein HCR_19980 [Hydrogenimonas cancrithermarum]
MFFTLIHTIHLLAAFVYGGFLFTDILFIQKMQKGLPAEEGAACREAIMVHVRKVVPYALFVVVGTGIVMFPTVFGKVGPDGLTTMQTILLVKAFFGLWLGIRGFNQKIFKINPWLFKSHYFPFGVVVLIIILSQIMWAF